MVLTGCYQKMILKYFISAVGEFQHGNFGFHAFGSFRKLTPQRATATGANIFVYMTYRQCVYMYTAPRIDAPITNTPSQIKP